MQWELATQMVTRQKNIIPLRDNTDAVSINPTTYQAPAEENILQPCKNTELRKIMQQGQAAKTESKELRSVQDHNEFKNKKFLNYELETILCRFASKRSVDTDACEEVFDGAMVEWMTFVREM